ncbi:putative serine/threonine-protein kinase [Toxocara canis]|uniref:Putative serine/threonine-protein kinase n=1 Tax=Toxocara canis TaxID=6265 RepID=A0A0B2VTR6_TOXCA|nr:putative serine/threonine-protein kinase [Toxocara canis]
MVSVITGDVRSVVEERGHESDFSRLHGSSYLHVKNDQNTYGRECERRAKMIAVKSDAQSSGRAKIDKTQMQKLKRVVRKLHINSYTSESEVKKTKRYSPVPVTVPFGRLSENFIDQRLLKKPGDYVVSQTHNDALRFSVMCEDSCIIHLRIVEAKERFRIKDTLYPTATSIAELLQQFQQSQPVPQQSGSAKSVQRATISMIYLLSQKPHMLDYDLFELIQNLQQMNVLSAVVGKGVILRRGVVSTPLSAKHDICAMFIKDDSQLHYTKFLCVGNVAKTFVGKMTVGSRSENVVIKEMNEYSEEELDNILMELHISNLVSSLTTGGAVLRARAVRLTRSPYLIVYPFANYGSYPDFALRQGAQLTLLDKITASEAIAKALADMHSFGVLHCDIGARNIFVRIGTFNSDSQDERLRSKFTFLLGDFRQAAITKTKEVDPMKPINLRWLAPEVFATKRLNSTTDVFAFGMTLYEIFTGNVPYYTIRAEEMRRKLIAGETLRPALNSAIDPNLCELMRSCWHAEPRDRPSMESVWLRLRAIRDSVIDAHTEVR